MNLHLISTFVLGAHWLIVAGLSIRVIMRRPPVGISLAWLAVISSAVFDAAFTRQLGALQQTYLRNSNRLELDAWRRRPALRKFTENTFRLLGPLL